MGRWVVCTDRGYSQRGKYVCTETVRRVTGLSAQKGDVHRKGNRTDIVFPQEKVVYVVHS